MAMISILIPTKDYDCHKLVEELQRQGEALGLGYEIIVGEDGTSAQALQMNAAVDLLANCRRVIKEKNIGRANIRNALALEARYPNLLFIDSDAVVEKDDFLQTYCNALKKNDVVCGGLYHTDILHDKECSLRFKYEKEADKRRDAATRNLAPHDKFTTFNFAIRRELFTSIFFNEKIEQYGYEDTLFGKELERRSIAVKHIDNALLHNGIEKNSVYLAKVEQSLSTLKNIEKEIGKTPLLLCADKLHRFHMTGLFMLAWRAAQRMMRRNLTGERASLTIFKLYKLGYFLSLKR